MNFKIVLHNRTSKDGTAKFYLKYYFKGKRFLLPVNLRIEPVFFNEKKEEVKKIHPRAEEYNLILNKAKADANDILIRAKLSGVEITPNLIEHEFNNPSTLKEVYPWLLREIQRRDLSSGTDKAYRAIANKLNEFAPGLRFAELDDIFVHKWDEWLKKKKKNDIDTRANAHKRLKSFLKTAVDRKLISKNPYNNFPIKKSNQESRRVHLTFAERDRFIELYESGKLSKSERKVLRAFLFSCFTGLRFSDCEALKAGNIMGDTIVIAPKKQKRTSQIIIKIPLTDYAKKLIADSDVKKYGSYFKHLSEQKTNEKLKALALKAGIRKHITTHVARHTFATLFWEKTKDVASLQRLLGHSDIKQTMIYTHVSDEILRMQMDLFEKS